MPDHPRPLTDKGYLTVAGEACAEIRVQKSRFIASIAPAADEETALCHVDAKRNVFRGANHHCYAYILGKNAGILRHQDDREPSGTAGVPILEALRGRQLTNVCAVVTRFFGGILLGRGGLTRAYGNACLAAIDAAQIVRMQPSVRFTATFAYAVWDRVKHRLGTLEALLVSTKFSQQVQADILVPEKEHDAVLRALSECAEGPVPVGREERLDYPWP